jgi:hypothetical protein
MPTPGHTSPTPSVRTFILAAGENQLNMKPRMAAPGDIVECGDRRLVIPAPGHHRGKSGQVWINTAENGSVSMGCHTQVAWGHLTVA